VELVHGADDRHGPFDGRLHGLRNRRLTAVDYRDVYSPESANCYGERPLLKILRFEPKNKPDLCGAGGTRSRTVMDLPGGRSADEILWLRPLAPPGVSAGPPRRPRFTGKAFRLLGCRTPSDHS
jgi:hypothetical protein